jgi:hypothetical protein
MPNSVTRIGSGALRGCVSLTSPYFDGNAPSKVYCAAFFWVPFIEGDKNVTVYYIPGITCWRTNCGGTRAPAIKAVAID